MYDTEFAKVFKEEIEDPYDTEFAEEFKEEIELDEMKWAVGGVYHQEFKNGDKVYFRADSVQKNKRWKGMSVDEFGGKQKKAKSASADEKQQGWETTPKNEIPKGLKEEVEVDEGKTYLKVDLKKLKKQYDKNEDENRHTENYLMLAKVFGKPAEVKKVEAILKKNRKQGHTSKEDNDWMYKNINPYYNKIRNEEVELGEAIPKSTSYGLVKIGKRVNPRIPQHSPGQLIHVASKKEVEKMLKKLKKLGGDGYIMQGVSLKVGDKVKGVKEEVEATRMPMAAPFVLSDGVTGPTRMQVQKAFDNSGRGLSRSSPKPLWRERIKQVEKYFKIRDLKVDAKGTVQSFKEEVEEARSKEDELELAKAMAAFKKKGGKIKKLSPDKAFKSYFSKGYKPKKLPRQAEETEEEASTYRDRAKDDEKKKKKQ